MRRARPPLDSLACVSEETNDAAAGAGGADVPEQMRVRADKLARLRDSGIDPYPVTFPRTDTIAAIRERFPDLEPGTETGPEPGPGVE